MTGYFFVKWLHILCTFVLLGTGAGIGFFFVRAQRSGNPAAIAAVARAVVTADLRFTLTALILQPLTGVFLAVGGGYPLSAPWLSRSMLLYVFIGCCWVSLVWLQIRMRRMAAAASGGSLPDAYRRYYRGWLALGWTALAGVLAIFYWMVAKPGM